MSSQYLSLEEAAEKLGITPEKLVALRSEGRVRGLKDGASWKFRETDLQQLADDMASQSDEYDPYAMLADDAADAEGSSAGSEVLSESPQEPQEEEGSSGSQRGSDVNLVADSGQGSDVKVVTSADDDSDFTLKHRREDLVELDSGELDLTLSEPALTHDSGAVDVGDAPKSAAGDAGDDQSGQQEKPGDSGLKLSPEDDQDSDDAVLGLSDSEDLLGSSKSAGGSGMSSLELLDDLGQDDAGDGGKASGDVLSDLNVLSGESGGSGLISGDSGEVIGSDVLGSDVKKGSSSPGSSSRGSKLNLDDDDDLLITDNEDDLVLGGSDLSISGDSGINLMSPSDSGISLESEPLDLAGSSSISSLDLADEAGSDVGLGSSGKGVGSSGKGAPAEDFQLSPSGISVDNDADSSSQVIEVEDSAAFAEVDADAFGEVVEGDQPLEGDEAAFGDEEALEVEEDAFGEEETGEQQAVPAAAYEIPYTTPWVLLLALVMLLMSLNGILMTDLVRNVWTYTEPSAPVSGLTDMFLDLLDLVD